MFFIQSDQIVADVGYSEKGKRFSEAEYGKVIRNVNDLQKFGYWFVGRTYDPDVMKDALQRQQDGYYYSFFSNQCQDWADRLKRGAERIERERGLAPPRGFVAPVIAGGAFTVVIGAFLLAAGGSNIVYAFHGRDWRNLLPELLTALINLATGVLLLWNREFARVTGSLIIAIALALHGAINLFLGLFSKPRSHWIGKIVAGLIMLGCAALIATRWPGSGERLLGEAVGLSLLAGGVATIWLSWKTRTSGVA